MIKTLTSEEEFDNLIASEEKLIVVNFVATWCGPCRKIAPIFDQLAVDNPNVVFVKVDVDELESVAEKCGISAMPAFYFYKRGERIDDMKGASSEALEAMLAKHT